jgi:uncharacterized protein YycO
MSGFLSCGNCEQLEEKINEQTQKISNIVSLLEPIEIPGIVDQEIYVPLAHSSEMIPMRLPVEATRKEEADYLQTAILALNQKIKLLQLLESEKSEFSRLLTESLKSARDIAASAEETYAQLRADDQMHQKAILEVSSEINSFLKQKNQELEKINDIENQIFALTEQKSQLEQECADLENELKQNEIVKKQIITTQTELETIEKDRYNVFKKILAAAQTFREETKTLDGEARGVEEENKKLREKINELSLSLEKEKKMKHELMRKKLINLSTIQKLKGVKVLEEEQKSYSSRYSEIAKTYQSNIDVMKQDLQHSLLSYEKLISRLHQHHAEIKASVSEIQNQIKVTQNRVAIQEEIIEEYTAQNNLLHDRILGYQERLAQNVEYSKDDKFSKYIDSLCNKLLNFSDLFLLQAYKINIAYKAAENMKQILETTDQEIKDLEAEATELQKTSQVYLPDEDDIVDKAVSNAIKEFGRPLDYGFVRISNGNYLCGKNHVQIAFINSKLKVTEDGKVLDFGDYLRKIHG